MRERSFYTRTLFAAIAIVSQTIIGQKIGRDNFPPPMDPLEVTSIKTMGKITMDGKLDEPDWQRAIPVTDFFRVEPLQGGTYGNRTEVKILYDEKNIYFGVFCADPLGKKGLRIQDLRRDFDNEENDVFGIQIDAQNTKQYAVSFQTTPYGNQLDLQSFNDNNIDVDWNALWSVRTQRTERGYFAEFSIPFKSIRYDKPDREGPVHWGITFYRLSRKDVEKIVFPAIPQSFSENRMSYAAKLINLIVPPPSANIRIEPFALYQYNSTSGGDDMSINEGEPKIGADIKWAVRPNTVLDLTINTDFAQADVDRAINNLERFNIFFPERRQFFLENSGIWSGANSNQLRPFFSRTIGLQGTFNASPAPIDIGTRFTDRSEQRTLAGLFVRQRSTDFGPGSTFGVGRFTQNYGVENNVGVMVTHRVDDKNKTTNVDGQINTTITIDGIIRPKSEYTFSYLFSVSTDSENSGTGLSGSLSATVGKNRYFARYRNTFISSDYRPDMGFVFQQDVMNHNFLAYYSFRPKEKSFWRRWDPGIFMDINHDVEDFGRFQQASINIYPIYTWLKDNSFFQFDIIPTWQNINFDFAPLGLAIEQGRYFFTRKLVRAASDQSRKFSLSGAINWGKFYNGQRTTLSTGLRYAPLPNFSISGEYERNDIKDIGFENQDLTTDLYTASLRAALNPRVQFSAFYQFNSFDSQGRWNARFSWEYAPLSFIYLVFNESTIDAFDPIQRNTQFISKVTFLKQF